MALLVFWAERMKFRSVEFMVGEVVVRFGVSEEGLWILLVVLVVVVFRWLYERKEALLARYVGWL